MIEYVFLLGLAVAAFVGFNIGGSSTGIAWGPAVGAGLISKVGAGALMVSFVLLGGWTAGRNVRNPGRRHRPDEPVHARGQRRRPLFIGLGMLVANLYGVPVSTSMTAVGAIAGLGLATGSLNWETMGRIVSWWIVAPIIGFWVGGVIGRYLYPHLDRIFALRRSDGPLLATRRISPIPYPVRGPDTTSRELVASVLVLSITCYMAFSAGASNVANAVAPLIGSGALGSWARRFGSPWPRTSRGRPRNAPRESSSALANWPPSTERRSTPSSGWASPRG